MTNEQHIACPRCGKPVHRSFRYITTISGGTRIRRLSYAKRAVCRDCVDLRIAELNGAERDAPATVQPEGAIR